MQIALQIYKIYLEFNVLIRKCVSLRIKGIED